MHLFWIFIALVNIVILGVPALRCILSVYPMTVVYHSIRLSSHVPLFLPLMNIASYLFVLFFCSHASVRFIVRTCGGVTPLDSGPVGGGAPGGCLLPFVSTHALSTRFDPKMRRLYLFLIPTPPKYVMLPMFAILLTIPITARQQMSKRTATFGLY